MERICSISFLVFLLFSLALTAGYGCTRTPAGQASRDNKSKRQPLPLSGKNNKNAGNNLALRAPILEAMFLPVLRLHPHDKFRPATVSWMLPRAELRYKGHPTPILKKGEITDDNLHRQAHAGKQSGGGDQPTDFYLDYPDDAERDATRAGNLEEWACYTHITRRQDPIEIQYWFYYPYNGSISPVGDIAHEGDWEHITVRLKMDRRSIDKIYYYAHDDERSRWVLAEGHVTPDGRPIVYSARHTHGSYPKPGTWQTAVPGVKDETKNGGPERDYHVDLGWKSLDVDLDGFQWVNYNGKWGEPGAIEASSGFPGPKFQSSWKGDPPPR